MIAPTTILGLIYSINPITDVLVVVQVFEHRTLVSVSYRKRSRRCACGCHRLARAVPSWTHTCGKTRVSLSFVLLLLETACCAVHCVGGAAAVRPSTTQALH